VGGLGPKAGVEAVTSKVQQTRVKGRASDNHRDRQSSFVDHPLHTSPHDAIMGNANSQMLENLVQGSNCPFRPQPRTRPCADRPRPNS
jgi:hypothetical protein